MLPSNPRAPSRSRSIARQPPSFSNTTSTSARSRSASRPTDYPSRPSVDSSNSQYSSRRDAQPTKQIHTQRSMGALPSSRAKRSMDAPLPPPLPRLNPNNHASASSTSPYARPPPSRDSDTSSSSASATSSGSSFLDRMKHRRNLSSSQSSFEIDRDPLPSKPTSYQDKYDAAQIDSGRGNGPGLEQEANANDFASYGYAIWNRVTTAANNWSWSGSSTNNNNDNDNALISGVTPNAGDSELTKVLKAYHISKVRDRSELPDWLFDETERGLTRAYRRERNYEDGEGGGRRSGGARGRDDEFGFGRYNDDNDDAREDGRRRMYGDRDRERGGRGSLRDVYDSAATTAPGGGAGGRRGAYASLDLDVDETRSMPDTSSTGMGKSSKATARLKALRDAKRKAAFGSGSGSVGRAEVGDGSKSEYGYDSGSRRGGGGGSEDGGRRGFGAGSGDAKRMATSTRATNRAIAATSTSNSNAYTYSSNNNYNNNSTSEYERHSMGDIPSSSLPSSRRDRRRGGWNDGSTSRGAMSPSRGGATRDSTPERPSTSMSRVGLPSNPRRR